MIEIRAKKCSLVLNYITNNLRYKGFIKRYIKKVCLREAYPSTQIADLPEWIDERAETLDRVVIETSRSLNAGVSNFNEVTKRKSTG